MIWAEFGAVPFSWTLPLASYPPEPPNPNQLAPNSPQFQLVPYIGRVQYSVGRGGVTYIGFTRSCCTVKVFILLSDGNILPPIRFRLLLLMVGLSGFCLLYTSPSPRDG